MCLDVLVVFPMSNNCVCDVCELTWVRWIQNYVYCIFISDCTLLVFIVQALELSFQALELSFQALELSFQALELSFQALERKFGDSESSFQSHDIARLRVGKAMQNGAIAEVEVFCVSACSSLSFAGQSTVTRHHARTSHFNLFAFRYKLTDKYNSSDSRYVMIQKNKLISPLAQEFPLCQEKKFRILCLAVISRVA